ncbi:hypothetical protein Efla_000039 [Eimeria flavescens]
MCSFPLQVACLHEPLTENLSNQQICKPSTKGEVSVEATEMEPLSMPLKATCSHIFRRRLSYLKQPSRLGSTRCPAEPSTLSQVAPLRVSTFPDSSHGQQDALEQRLSTQTASARRSLSHQADARPLPLHLHLAPWRHMTSCKLVSASGRSALERPTSGPPSKPERITEQSEQDLLQAEQELLASLEVLRTTADCGAVYIVKTRLSKALPHCSAAAFKAADIGRLVEDLEKLKQEKATLMAFRHQTPREIRKEYTQMMLIGLATGLAAAIHPIFFIGSVYGAICLRRARMAEADRDAGTSRLEEVSRAMRQKKADLNALINELSRMVGSTCIDEK